MADQRHGNVHGQGGVSVEERDRQRAVVREWLGTGAINIFGMPFAGKDTQCLRLGRWLDAPVLSGGDILRKRDDLPGHVREMLDRGELIPVDEYLAVVTPYLRQDEFDGRPLVLSSVGRFHGEEESILAAAEGAHHPMRIVIFLDLGHDTVWERWRKSLEVLEAGQFDRGDRADDAESALVVRLKEFEAKTLPVLEVYRRLGLLAELDGVGTPDEVEERILAALYAKATEA